MDQTTLEHLRFPIGRFQEPESFSAEFVEGCISKIETLPGQLRAVAEAMTEAQLDTPYRPEGWTARQVVHHLADSHINSYTRFKLALTEDHPSIRPYDEVAWAELPDGKSADINISLSILDAIHHRLTMVLRELDSVQLKRTFYHPESKAVWSIAYTLAFYAWHGEHHLGHLGLVVNK
ncbi:MAG: YfiT family bacillithiol transferase [Saprospiraceae bacterium]